MGFIFEGIASITIQQGVMISLGLLLIYLAVVKEYEPALLLPMGFGTILVNIPLTSALTQIVAGVSHPGALSLLFDIGISTELFPLLIFIAVGAMIDFTPFSSPHLRLFLVSQPRQDFLDHGISSAFRVQFERSGFHRNYRRC